MNNKIKTLLLSLAIVLLVSIPAFASQSLDLYTNGSGTYTKGAIVVISGQATDDGIPMLNTTVSVEVISPNDIVVFYTDTTTDEDGNFRAVFTLPSSSLIGPYTIEASTDAASASVDFAISAASKTGPMLQGWTLGGLSLTTPTKTVYRNTREIVLVFDKNVNYFYSSNNPDTIMGVNENNEDCFTVYNVDDNREINCSVDLISNPAAGTEEISYYDISDDITAIAEAKSAIVLNLPALDEDTTYRIDISKDLSANNGLKMGVSYSVYFKTGAGLADGTVITDTGSEMQTSTINISATTDSQGRASASITQQQVSDALAAVSGTNAKPVIEINVETPAGATAVETSIPKAAMDEIVAGETRSMTISSSVASITFDQDALATIADEASSGNITIIEEKVDVSTLSTGAQAQVGDHPVYNFNITCGDNNITQFGGNVTVSVPYTLADGEDANNIVIYYVKADGTLEVVKNCVYDETSGNIVFITDHFSTYALGYNQVEFSDVSGWYTDYVNYLAARNIVNGKGGDTFAPLASITRAEFAQILANMSGADLSAYDNSSFTDVTASDWYCRAVAWAYENGIVQGYNGKYNPNANITRQDIAVMINRYAEKVAKYDLPVSVDEITFSDQNSISSYALDAVSAMQQAGIISGRNDNTFDPIANATRAECAKMIALLIQSMVL